MRTKQFSFSEPQISIGILSDTHGAIDPAVGELMRQCDLVIHAGDVMDAAVLTGIRQHTQALAVAGNNDRDGVVHRSDPSQEAVETLPDLISIELPSGSIVVEHGHRHGFSQPCHQKLIASHPDARAIVYGHTHKQLVDKSQTPWILNPGAAGYTRNYGGPKCLVLHVDSDDWRVDSHVFEGQ
ncbi:MAG: metallophosphoesterase family protein [Granulosicoccus sp.]